jgi:hypothetical protein
VRASVDGLTWPIRTPARLELLTSVPGRGKLAVSGGAAATPYPSELRLRLVDFDLAPLRSQLHIGAKGRRPGSPVKMGLATSRGAP